MEIENNSLKFKLKSRKDLLSSNSQLFKGFYLIEIQGENKLNWTFKGIGTAEVDNKKVTCDFSLSSDEFFDKFSSLASALSADTHDTIARAIDKKTTEKIKKKDDEFISFFNKVETALKVSTYFQTRCCS